MNILLEHHWPGNVRELENTIERAVILTRETEITPSDLPGDILTNLDITENITRANKTLTIPVGKIPLKEIERMVMEETLKQSGGNKNIALKKSWGYPQGPYTARWTNRSSVLPKSIIMDKNVNPKDLV